MPRTKRSTPVDLSIAQDLTLALIDRLVCPDGKTQAFLRDGRAPGLRVRVTTGGAKSFVFEAKLNRQTIRRTIGDVRAWSIEAARVEANRLRVSFDMGDDPREIERRRLEAKDASDASDASAVVQSTTIGELWPRYLAQGKPKRKDAFKPGYLLGLSAMAAAGGVPKRRGAGTTRPGPLHPLMACALSAIDEDTLKCWYDAEAARSKHQAARALMMFRGFMRWASSKPELRSVVDREAGRSAAITEVLPAQKRRSDCLEAAQVSAWFAGTSKLSNRTAATYLEALLLTGARREEMAALRWVDVDFKWSRVTLADKVDATRVIPLGIGLATLLKQLPHHTEYVFASVSKSGRIADPRSSHAKVLLDAGITGLTIHGLRRSFSLLGEAAGAPAGAIAQVMGHKPSATAEGYRPRSIDALRPYLQQIENHILRYRLSGVEVSGVAAENTILVN